jgi:hypothetical protein
MFSPLAFPTGKILFELSISDASLTHLKLSPFEHFRERVAIVGIADGLEGATSANGTLVDSNTPNGVEHDLPSEPRDMDEIVASLAIMKELYPQALVHQVFIFEETTNTKSQEGIVAIPPLDRSKSTAIKTAMCDLASLVLGELTEYARSIQGLSMLESPNPEPEDPDLTPSITRTTSLRSQSPQSGTPQSTGLERTLSTEERVMHRMSMPAQTSSNPGGQIKGASGKFVATRIPGAPSTFEDAQRSRDPSTSGANSAEHSQERVSVQGFGSSSVNEKARNRNKGRVGIVIGSLYLQAGRWSDALKELVESTSTARGNSDYLWQAKGLELILVSLLMMGWAGMDFQIPQICYPSVTDRISMSTSKSPLVNSTSPTDGSPSGAANRLVSLQNLGNLLPELLNYILNLYTRAANITEEVLPQLAFSESVLRFSKLLSSCHLRDGHIDEQVLNHIVMNEPISEAEKYDRARGGAYLRKTELTSRLFRALPTSTENALSSKDLCPILVSMASVLSSLGLHRKKAFILRELISTLVPALVQARKIGAAEMGIHPAAGLSAIEGAGISLKSVDPKSGNLQRGLGAFMTSLGEVYGIVELETTMNDTLKMNGTSSGDDNVSLKWDSNEAIMIRALRNHRLRKFGILVLKVDLLVACVNLCEALPDFQGVLQFTVELLQTISPGIPLPPDGKGMQYLSRDEQMRLMNNIKRTVSVGNKLGLKGLEAEYWDDFVIRGVELLEPPQSEKLVSHSKPELQMAEAIQDTSRKNPFIYNPFAKTASTATPDKIVVSDDQTMFKVDLQNPFEFELEIERLTLETEGVAFDSHPMSLTVAPYCMHTVNVAGVAKESGSLKITGCIIKVKDCRERRFPIFKNTWKPRSDIKIKLTGLAARNPTVNRPLSTSSEVSQGKAQALGNLPEAETLLTTVINPQPTLTVISSSLPQSSVMLLEGETKTFSITFQNTSTTTTVDFLIFTFRDSTTAKLQSAMSNKDIVPADLYELELQLSKKSLQWKRSSSDQEILIKPGQTSTFIVEMFGIPGLTNATVQVDYGCLGVPKSEIKDKFYTRQIILPLTVTVNASVEMVKWDILPFTGDFAWLNQRRQKGLSNGRVATPNDPISRSRAISRSNRSEDRKQLEDNQFQSLLSRLGIRSHGSDHCLLLLDLRNAWPSPLSISLQVRDTTSLTQSPSPDSDPWRRAYAVHEVLQPGHISRLVLLIPRIFLPNPHAPIPALNPSTQRQYVVSATKIPPDVELAARESFWFRTELLKHIRGNWTEDAIVRDGTIELRGIRLNARMLDALRIEDVDISFHLAPTTPPVPSTSSTFSSPAPSPPPHEPESAIHQTGRYSFTVPTHTFLTLTTTIHNRSSSPIHPLLRLQPSLRNLSQPTALDLSKRLVWTGMLQRALPIIRPGEGREVKLGICAMSRGTFEVGGSVEEIRVWKKDSGTGDDGLDALALKERERGRRIWHAREACVIIAKDAGVWEKEDGS